MGINNTMLVLSHIDTRKNQFNTPVFAVYSKSPRTSRSFFVTEKEKPGVDVCKSTECFEVQTHTPYIINTIPHST